MILNRLPGHTENMIKPESIKVMVAQADDDIRLEVFLARNVEDLSRRKAIELIRDGAVWIGNIKARKGMTVSAGQRIEIQFPQTRPQTTVNLEVLYLDDELVIVNKSAGIPCHPLRLGETGTLLQLVSEQFPEVLTAGPKAREGGLLHRLDTDTSGCVAFARTPEAFAKWAPRFLEGGVGKYYLAVVNDSSEDHYLPEVGKGVRVIDIPLARHPSDSSLMVALIREGERHRGEVMKARTEIRTLAKGDGCALVEAKIERGRMHQIRLHLAAIGHPIVGDKLYNSANGIRLTKPESANGSRYSSTRPKDENRKDDTGFEERHDESRLIGRQALHAYRLALDGQRDIVAPMPEDMRSLYKKRGLPLI